MSSHALSKWGAAAALLGGSLLGQGAQAATQYVDYDHLTNSATVLAPLGIGDTLFVDTFTTETGALNQRTTFTVGPGVGAVTGSAAWLATPAASEGPRLIGVNIDLFDASNTLVASDTFAGVLADFAHSTFASGLAAGTYTLVASGNGIRDSSLDISLTLAVPEPETYALLLAGIGAVGFAARRRKQGAF